jgi:phenylalanyl-tRNA synthetase beta chain
MFELGIPVHVFDYDRFKLRKLIQTKSKGGEDFTSVDGISYQLDKDMIIIKDGKRVIDLCGIKGGENTGINPSTKNIYVHVPIYAPYLIRRASQKLSVSSDASYIYERGANAGGTIDTLKRVVNLIQQEAGGEIASKVIDLKKQSFNPWKLKLKLNNLNKVLGIEIPVKQVLTILSQLNLSPKLENKQVTCIIPTYRGDLKIEEDLIEEVARIWGYNKFPKTLPLAKTPREKIPYLYNRSFELKLKKLLISSGYSEVMSYSLVSSKLIKSSNLKITNHIKIANPVSREYKYLRISLLPSLLQAVKYNQDNQNISFFEFSKVYLGKVGKTKEPYRIAAINKGNNYNHTKGLLDTLLERLNIKSTHLRITAAKNSIWHPTKSGVIEKGNKQIGYIGKIHPNVLSKFEISTEISAMELDVELLSMITKPRKFNPVAKNPPQIEDLTLSFPKQTMMGEVINSILNQKYIVNVILKEKFKNAYTFRLWYQHPSKTLNNKEVERIRKTILKNLKTKFGGLLKE